MPRQIRARWILDDIEAELLFTEAALGADPDAVDFLPLTEGLMDQVDDTRGVMRKSRRARSAASATRIVSNARLDATCEAFGDQLFLAANKERTSTLWTKFFHLPVSRFIRTALDRQVTTVRGWLTTEEPTLDPFRDDLIRWSDASQKALDDTEAAGLIGGSAQQRREKLAEDLTRERDALRDALAARARERGLARDWPELFFIKTRRRSRPSEDNSSEDA